MYQQVPTTLLDWGAPDRAYQGRSFAHLWVEPAGSRPLGVP